MDINEYEIVEYEKCMFVYPLSFNKGFNGTSIDMGILIANSKHKPIVVFGLPRKVKRYIEKRGLCLKSKRTKFRKYTAIFQSPEVGKFIDIGDRKEKKHSSLFLKEGCYVMTIEEAKEVSKLTGNSFFMFELMDKKLISYLNE